MLHHFISGGVFMTCLAISLIFTRLQRRTHDRLFIFFSIAFAILAIERVLLLRYGNSSEYAPYVYLVRLLAYVCIIAAIIDTNRRG